MDLHYAGDPMIGGGRRAPTRRRTQRGGDASFTLLDHIASLGLDKDAFEAAAKTGWTVLANLGRGGFGSVDHIRINMPAGPKEYVMKTLFVCPKAKHYAQHEYNAHKYMIEVQTSEPTDILIEHIIPAIALGETETAAGKNYHIFFEREVGTSLGQFISEKQRRREFIKLDETDDIKVSLANALHSIHNAGLIHRDIKPDNIFIISNAVARPKYKIKIIDFGLAILSAHPPQNPGAGTPDYFSPAHRALLERRDAAVRNGTYNNANPAFKYRYSAVDDNYAASLTNRKVMQIASPYGGAPPLHMLAAPPRGPPRAGNQLYAGPPQGPQHRPVGARGRLLQITQTETPISTPPNNYGALPSPIGPIGMAVNPGAFSIGSISPIAAASSGVHGGRSRFRRKHSTRRARRYRR